MERQAYSKLKGVLVEKGIKQKQVAKLLGLSVPSLNKRINGTGSDFTITEARKICIEYNIESDIFF